MSLLSLIHLDPLRFKGEKDQRQRRKIKEEAKRRKGSQHVRTKSHTQVCEEQTVKTQIKNQRTQHQDKRSVEYPKKPQRRTRKRQDQDRFYLWGELRPSQEDL
ncbi:unnamed protein product [Cochlearia groenlandica]